jgi:hypothetical protein
LRVVLFVVVLVLFAGCTPKKEYINIYDKNITKEPLPCLGLDLMMSEALKKELTKLYHFKPDCEYRISLDSRGGIVCNSSFNSALKANSNFPNSYLRLELKRGVKTLFSYYVDLTSSPDEDDIKRAFEVFSNKVKLP